MLNQNSDNYNSQSKQMKISLAANENSKSEQVNSLKRGKKRVTTSWTYMIGQKGGAKFLNKSWSS